MGRGWFRDRARRATASEHHWVPKGLCKTYRTDHCRIAKRAVINGDNCKRHHQLFFNLPFLRSG